MLAFLAAGILLAVALRFSLFDFRSVDMGFITRWYRFIASHGGFGAHGVAFSDYTPPYLYLLTLTTYVPLPSLYSIKLISVFFDFVLATFAALIIGVKYEGRTVRAFAFFAVLFTPTVFVNSGMWGQSDSIYASLLLGAVFFSVKQRPVVSVAFLAVALAFKLQAVFLLPFFLVLTLRRRIPLWSFVLLPAVYLLAVLPSWIAGRPLLDLLTIYLDQAGAFPRLTLNAPNAYQWVPVTPNKPAITGLLGNFGVVLAMSAAYLLCFVGYRGKVEFGAETIVRLALASALLMPFLLPYMHDRYFYVADVLSVVYAFYFPRRFFVPLIVVTASLFGYTTHLFRTESVIGLPYVAVFLGIAVAVVVADLVRDLYPALQRRQQDDATESGEAAV